MSLFGPTRLNSEQLAILDALAEHREVHLWLPHPSPELWRRLTAAARTRRRDDPTRDDPRHPLLASLGRDARELQLVLRGLGAEVTDEHLNRGPRPPTLLGRLQSDIRDDLPACR